MDPTGFEPVTTGVKTVEVTVTSTGPCDPGEPKTPLTHISKKRLRKRGIL